MTFDLTTQAGIDAARADVDKYESELKAWASRDLLPWGFVIGKRREDIAKAAERLAKS